MREAINSGTRSRTQIIEVHTEKRTQLKDITELVERFVRACACSSGVCHVFVPHTTAGVMINEGDDPDVARDIGMALDKLVPHQGDYRHAEGNSDSHIKAAMTGSSATIFVEDGRLALGRWQSIFFCEFDGPRKRNVHLKIVSDD